MSLDLFITISFYKRYERMQTTGTALRTEPASADDRQHLSLSVCQTLATASSAR